MLCLMQLLEDWFSLGLFDVLDVGCGVNPSGSVNCDLYVEDVGHRSAFARLSQQAKNRIDVHGTANFVLCDVQHLPFKDGAFKDVVSNHVIEHVPNPSLLVSEMVRVCRKSVTVRCPHFLGECHSEFHLWHFKRSSFPMASMVVSDWKYLPHEFFPLFRVPREMTLVIRKGVKRP